MPEVQHPDNVVSLRSRTDYRPDMAAFARQQVAGARESLGLDPDEFADLLTPLLGWKPTGAMIESWEHSVVPPGDVLIAVNFATQGSVGAAASRRESDLIGSVIAEKFADVTAVYTSRSDFMAKVPLDELLDAASDVRAMGLSLNLLCQHYADRKLRDLVAGGTTLKCLFLKPGGAGTRANEVEEGYPDGHLSSLTELNIQTMLHRVRDRLPDEHRGRVQVATYDEPIRFNVILIDGETCIAQPYLRGFRGLESPTFVIQRRWATAGLYSMFDQIFTSTWERGTLL